MNDEGGRRVRFFLTASLFGNASDDPCSTNSMIQVFEMAASGSLGNMRTTCQMKNTLLSILAYLLIATAASRLQAQSLVQPANPPAAPADLVNAFHATFGDHHVRAVHTKGIILEGSFIPDEQVATLTMANHLQREPSRVVLRLSDFTGLPEIPDNISAASPRGLAI